MRQSQYEGHHSPRFVLKAAYDAYWKARAEAPPWFHGIENMTLDSDGFLRLKGHAIERLDPDAEITKGKARILAARCRYLEAIGKDVNKFNLILDWKDKVQEPAGAWRER